MTFFSRKKQPSTSTNPSSNSNIVVAQTPSQALAQTRESSARSLSAHQSTGSSGNIRAQSPQAQPVPPSLSSRINNAPEPQVALQQLPPTQSQRQPNYPWSMRQLTMLPQSPLPRSPPQNSQISPSPFPRYGHSVPAIGNQSGELFLFGGLVRDVVRNDLFCISSRDQTACLWQVQGDTPSHRVGHASALVSNVLIVWGGDTKTDGHAAISEKLDDGLYLLNLVTREWTRIDPEGPKPLGRYGHAVAMIGTRFYVFGGQVDGEFLNDLWSFDLNSLVKSEPHWEQVQTINEPPHRRTGHACASYGEMLYVFGGTDGQYHYNDTWCFDPRTQRWTELQCIGFIPAPREGHSVAVVDDVIYIFGGRGVDGKDLGDLTGFRISNKRWYMFQNMGPAPSGRSGHAMSAVGSRVYVLGGESYTSTRSDDPTIFHVLDTKHIKYPDSSTTSRSSGQNRKPSGGSSHISQMQLANQSASSLQNGGRVGSPALVEGENARRTASPTYPPGASIPNGYTNGQIGDIVSRDFHSNSEPQMVSSDGRMTPSEKQERSKTPEAHSRAKARTPTPTITPHNEHQYDQQPEPKDMINRAEQPLRASSPPDNSQHPKSNTLANPGHGQTGSTGNASQDTLRILRLETNALRKKETWMKAALAKAIREGCYHLNNEASTSDSIDDEKLEHAADLVVLRQLQAKVQSDLSHEILRLSESIKKHEQQRDGAMQEAAFYRAKMTAYESGSSVDIARVESDRAGQLESKLAALSADYASQEAKLLELRESLNMQSRLREQTEIRAQETGEHLKELEEACQKLETEHSDLLSRHETCQRALQDHAERLISQTSAFEQKEAAYTYAKSRLDALESLQQQHLQFVEQTHSTLDVSSQRLSETTTQWEIATQRISEIENELAEIKVELESRTAEATSATERLAQVENAWAQSREEADALRSLTTQRLGELLDSHRDLRADEDRLVDNHNEKVRAMEVELASLRSLQSDIGQHSEQTLEALSQARQQNLASDKDRRALKVQVMGLRSQLSNAVSESGKLRQELMVSQQRVNENEAAVAKSESRFNVLRRYLVESGVSLDSEIFGESSHYSVAPENRRTDAGGASLDRELEDLRAKHQEALEQISSLTSELQRTRLKPESPSAVDQVDQVQELRRALAESEKAHQERMRQLETDYQTAVHYVKGSEKMLHRMKEELARQKVANNALQSEIDATRAIEVGSKGRNNLNGRGTPMSEDSHDAHLRPQILEIQRQNQRLVAENQDLRRRFDSLDRDLEIMRESLLSSQQEAEAKAIEIERLGTEVDRLEDALSFARQAHDTSFVDQLGSENALLQRKNEELSKKIELLLEVDQTGFDRSRPLSNFSDHSSGRVGDFETFYTELDDWHRKLAGSSLHSRVVDDGLRDE